MNKENMLTSPPVILSALMVILFFTDILLNGYLSQSFGGVVPRDMDHISGILFSSLFHGSIQHLSGNLIPFFVLSLFLSSSLTNLQFYGMWILISVISGSLVWLFGTNGLHLGASSVIFGIWASLLVFAVKRRKFKDVLIGLLVLFIYGATFFFGMIPRDGVSFEGHIFGALAGIVFALFIIKKEKENTNPKIK